ncbi:hypothetical protein [Lysinibacillus varians]|uniref:Uncharacterized protein n=1 Tax=Lysinibacillus varians TaxID=1145276 RepID=A0ABY2T8K2_9BACI|nr:hypothetical protein [Lysinibacillus varians]AHN24474.1 hypothetical protein T479_19900 [Lysinibacillus varians]TKI60522.1 hypothetical protein FC752_15160 [Lysinibacillus varians]
MLSIYGYPNGDGNWTIFYSEVHIPETIKRDVVPITVENQPEDGKSYVLRRNPVTEEFYWEPIYPVLPEDEEPPINEPSEEVPPQLQVSVEEMQAQILLNTEYLVSRIELGLGGK